MNKIEFQIYKDFAEAWNMLSAELIIKHLSHSFRYYSQGALESLDYEGYCAYIKGKFNTIRATDRSVIAELGYDEVGTPTIRLNQCGSIAYYKIIIEADKVIKADMCAF